MYAVCSNLNRQKSDQVALDKKQKQQTTILNADKLSNINHDLYETLAFVNTHSYEATFFCICIRNIYSYGIVKKW
jgi:hypothetical protein